MEAIITIALLIPSVGILWLTFARLNNANKLNYSQTLEKLRESKQVYNSFPVAVQNGIYGRSLLKSIKFLQNRLVKLDKELEQTHA